MLGYIVQQEAKLEQLYHQMGIVNAEAIKPWTELDTEGKGKGKKNERKKV